MAVVDIRDILCWDYAVLPTSHHYMGSSFTKEFTHEGPQELGTGTIKYLH